MSLDQDYTEEKVEEKEMSFFDHIDVLRKHLLRSAYFIVGFSIVALIYMDFIFHRIIVGPLNKDFITYRVLCQLGRKLNGSDDFCIKELKFTLQNTEVAGQFMLAFKLAFLVGIIAAMPFVLYQMWLFLKPALSKKEIKNTRGFVFYTSFLFLSGISFGYFILCPISINFLSGFNLSDLIKNEINIDNVLSFISMIVLGTGLIFELPILMYFLGRSGLISSAFLIKYRKHAFVVILVLAAIATPPDIVSQVILTIPLYSLFEVGVFIIKRVEKQKMKEANG
ncbi:MAG: twin-arginine translocase subunit TatC [Bacteroidia bacterium]|nr:twin-arginine translocase subunit TatC [Bacteroidia bacterium]